MAKNRAILRSFDVKKRRVLSMVIHVRGSGDYDSVKICMETRQKTTIEPDSLDHVGDGIYKVTFNIGIAHIGEMFCYPVVILNDKKLSVILPGSFKKQFFIKNIHLNTADKGKIFFPLYDGNMHLFFECRMKGKYDGYKTKLKEIMALVLYKAFKLHYNKKNIWLIFEKFSMRAQDNGYYFFRYCMENLSDKEKKNIYYVMDDSSPDLNKVKKYSGNVLKFMSLKQMIYILAAKIYVAQESRSHLYAWRSKLSIVKNKSGKRPIFFLQHGVTALKDVSPLYGVNGSVAMDYFLTTSKFEQDIVVDKLGYDRDKAPILGFARWDGFNDIKSDDDKLILMVPTWRPWLEDVDDDVFKKSDYYRSYMSLLEDEKIKKVLEDADARLVLYAHPKFADYFRPNKDGRVQIADPDKTSMRELICKCHMLITDYSSVAFDVFYQKKPVIFYRFDKEKYLDEVGSLIDLDKEGFGMIANQAADIADDIIKLFDMRGELSDNDKAAYEKFFDVTDDKNCERIYKFLKEKGY